MPPGRRTSIRRVYVIDDDLAVLESTAFLLETFGFECRTFPSAVQFLKSVDGLEPGCILTDLSMPEMDGWALREALEKRSNDWPMFLMSSEGRPELRECAILLGFSGFLPKPLDADAFAAMLERVPAG